MLIVTGSTSLPTGTELSAAVSTADDRIASAPELTTGDAVPSELTRKIVAPLRVHGWKASLCGRPPLLSPSPSFAPS